MFQVPVFTVNVVYIKGAIFSSLTDGDIELFCKAAYKQTQKVSPWIDYLLESLDYIDSVLTTCGKKSHTFKQSGATLHINITYMR